MRRELAFSGKVEYNCGMSDLHTHSAFSPDGVSPLEEMAARAHEQGLKYFGVSEHFDFDYAACGILIHGEIMPLTDEEGYFSAARALQQEYAAKGMRLLVGGEYGFCPDKGCCERYLALTGRKKPDFIINSVHTVDGADCYFPEYFEGKSREQAYGDYLERVRESLDAPYPYDIVAHIGYVGRKAPYPDRMLRYDDFPALFDDILKTIIQKGKILELDAGHRRALFARHGRARPLLRAGRKAPFLRFGRARYEPHRRRTGDSDRRAQSAGLCRAHHPRLRGI